MNIVDCSDERLAQMEASIEAKLENYQAQNPVISGEVLENNTAEQDFSFDEIEARDKISRWFGGILAGGFIFLSKRLEISKEQGTNLGTVWGRVVGKWYPRSWLEQSTEVGDTVSSFESETTAVKETWVVFGDRVLERYSKNSKKVPESEFKENSSEVVENFQEVVENPENSKSPTDKDNSKNFVKNSKNIKVVGGVVFPKTMGDL